MNGDFRFGIEEEYFVNDAAKRDAARGRIREFFTTCQEDLTNEVQSEMLEPQIEVATPPSADFAQARAYLAQHRRSIADCAAEFGLSVMAEATLKLPSCAVAPTAEANATLCLKKP